jgi:hypothetical protein
VGLSIEDILVVEVRAILEDKKVMEQKRKETAEVRRVGLSNENIGGREVRVILQDRLLNSRGRRLLRLGELDYLLRTLSVERFG